MLFYTLGQSQVFLAMLYVGVALGAVMDALRLARKMLSAGRILSIALDAVFCAIALFAMMLTLFYINAGEARPYALLGALSGFVLYMGTVSPLVRALATWLGRGLVRAIKTVGGWRVVKKILK